jgi:muramoyltetrapeptide carboxypeptidase
MVLKPPRLRRGDLIGLVAPASTPSRDRVEKSAAYLEKLGYSVKMGKRVMETHGYLAGTDSERASDLNDMIRDNDVKAILAIRGGYGTPRILSLIDYGALKRNPKIIAGYSDITALQLAIFRKIELVTFSAPMIGVELCDNVDPYTEEQFWRMVTSRAKVGELRNPVEEPVKILKNGKGTGKILGGNLATVVSLMGTPYLPVLRDSIVVLEDVDEAPHRIDRMLIQLKNAGILDKISGLVFGKFSDCVPSDPTKPFLTIDQILDDVAHRSSCPVMSNFQYGHIPKKLTLPLGLMADVNTKRGTIEVLEAAVS